MQKHDAEEREIFVNRPDRYAVTRRHRLDLVGADEKPREMEEDGNPRDFEEPDRAILHAAEGRLLPRAALLLLLRLMLAGERNELHRHDGSRPHFAARILIDDEQTLH